MKIPTTLKHKPVIVTENYEKVDGRSAYNSDAKGLSLGLAQWNDRGKVDISAKFGVILARSGLDNRRAAAAPSFRFSNFNLPHAAVFSGTGLSLPETL